MAGPIHEVTLDVDKEALFKQIDDMYKDLEKLYQDASRRMLFEQQRNFRAQQTSFAQYIRTQQDLQKNLQRTLIDLNGAVFNSVNTQNKQMQSLFKSLPKDIGKQAKNTINEYNKLVNDLNDINTRIDLGETSPENDVKRDKLMAQAEEHNKNVLRMMQEQGEAAQAFSKFQEEAVGRYQKELDQLSRILEDNRTLHDEEMDHIKTIADVEERRDRRRSEKLRFTRVEKAAQHRMAATEAAMKTGGQTGDFKQALRGPLGNLLHLGRSALEIGGMGFTFGAVAHDLQKAAHDLRQASKDISLGMAAITSVRDPGAFGVRSDVYQLSRQMESYIEGGEEMTRKVVGLLAGAGLPTQGIQDKVAEVVGLGFESGLGPEKVANIYDKLYRELRVPAFALGETFIDIRDRAKNLQIPFDEYFDNLSTLQNATKMYGYSLYDSISVIDRFSYQLRKGILSVQDLIAARENITKVGTGERAFLGTQLLEKLPQSVRDAVNALGGAQDPLAMAEAIKGALENAPIVDLTTMNQIASFSAKDAEETRKAILQYIEDLAHDTMDAQGSTAEMLYLFREFSKQFLNIDLQSMPLKTQQAILTAFKESGLSGVNTAFDKSLTSDSAKRSKQLDEAIKAGMQTAIDSSTLMQKMSTGIGDIYRGITEDLKLAVLSLSDSTGLESFRHLERSIQYGRDVDTLKKLMGYGSIEGALGGTQKISALSFEKAAIEYRGLGGSNKVLDDIYELLRDQNAFAGSPSDVQNMKELISGITHKGVTKDLMNASFVAGMSQQIAQRLYNAFGNKTAPITVGGAPIKNQQVIDWNKINQVNVDKINVNVAQDTTGALPLEELAKQLSSRIKNAHTKQQRKGTR